MPVNINGSTGITSPNISSDDISVQQNANLPSDTLRSLYGDGTTERPFDGLVGVKNANDAGILTESGDYYIKGDTATHLVNIELEGYYNSRADENCPGAWVKLNPSVVTSMIRQQNVSSLQMSSDGIITFSNLINDGCGADTGSYALTTDFVFSSILFKANRQISIHQCPDIWSQVSYSGLSGNVANSIDRPGLNFGKILVFGSTIGPSVEDIEEADTTSSENGTSACRWDGDAVWSRYTDDGTVDGSIQTPTVPNFIFPYVGFVAKGGTTNQAAFGLNCANETNLDQTGTTHEWWVGV